MKKYLFYVVLCVSLLCAVLTQFAAAEGSIDPEAQSIGLEGVGNARELGGYQSEDGRTVKRGVFLRTAALGGATEADIQRLGEVYQLATVIDLRMTSEIEAAPDPEIEGVKNIHLGIIDEEALEEKRQSLSPEDLEGLDLTNTLDRLKMASKLGIVGDQMYINFLSGDAGKAGYRQLFQELLELPEGGAVLFHCTQGKDRTGCAAMLILSALGVDEETILADFTLTNIYNEALIESERQMLSAQGVEGEEQETYLRLMDEVDAQYMINALDWMKDSYGSALGYISDELGIEEAQLETLRDRYLEEKTENENAA